MSSDLLYYAKKFSKLRVNYNRQRGVAPHKPILLLSAIEQIKQGKVQRNQFYLSPELIATFLKYWGQFGSANHNADIALPFFHLQGDDFWHLRANPGFEATVASKTKIRGLNALRNVVKYAYVDDALFSLLTASETRRELTDVLINSWFNHQAETVEELLSYDEFEQTQLKLFDSGGATYTVEDLKDQQRIFVRNAAFRRIVTSLYNQQCAFCHLRIVSDNNHNIVDGSHILPFSEFRDDRFDNGISLCKNHHWAFDHGWFGIDDNYRIIVARDRLYEEPSEYTRQIKDFHGEQILLPVETEYEPRLSAIEWHREYWGIAN